ncbi:MAG: polyphenol oxidase family protein [Solirubrobacteraceae bacterium]
MSAELTAPLPGGAVLFSDRSDGNMSSVGGHGARHGAEARARLRDRIGLQALCRGYQVHGDVVVSVDQMPLREPPTEQLPRADGQATSLTGLGATVLAADCLPVAIAREGAVAMVHAGWRGLAAGVLQSGLAAVRELGAGTGEREELVAVLGPCAGPCCYEVGPEVHASLASGVTGRAPLDLRAIARRQLQAAGVNEIAVLGGCTICDERFFSHRREGVAAGRMAAVAWLS